jgi:hypothetical protein
MDYKQKYLKYKMKYLDLISKFNGGFIKRNELLRKIKSIGFEIETSDLAPVIIKDNLVLPYGFNNISGSVIKTNMSNHNIHDNCTTFMTQDSYPSNEQFELTDDIGYYLTNQLKKPFKLNNGNQINIENNPDSTFGHVEFIITYLMVNDANIICNKFREVLNYVEKFFNDLNKQTYKSINSKDKIYLYQHLLTNTFYLSYLSKKDFRHIQITPQITLGINFNDIEDIIKLLENDFNQDIEYVLYQNDVESLKIDLIQIFGEDAVESNKNYLILLYHCFLNTDSIFNYNYDEKINSIVINRDSLKIKIRHNFSKINKYIMSKPDLDNNYNKILKNLSEEKIKAYRISQLNRLILREILENDKLIQKSELSKKITENITSIWGNLTESEIKYIISQLKKTKSNFNIFNTGNLKNINNILEFIVECDYIILYRLDDDPIISGGTLFDINNDTILLELRYFDKKGPMYPTIEEYKKRLNDFDRTKYDRE